MKQIVFLNPFRKDAISGGIKTTYTHALLLRQLGFNVTVFQPDGPPSWLPSTFQALNSSRLAFRESDILVFPETLNGFVAEMAQRPTPATKVMFCQNQYYMFCYNFTAENYAKFGFTKFIAPGLVAKRLIESVLGLRDVDVVPPFIDPAIFHPREKVMQIATVPRKFPPLAGVPAQSLVLNTMLGLKYPHLRSIPWNIVDGKTEQETAEIFGRSALLLALSYMEACPLVPLEAMASGCVVIGYTGHGGLEYANSKNGFWFSPEQLEEVVDAIARVVDGLNGGDPGLRDMQEVGMATAAWFNRQQTSDALRQVYGSLVSR